MQVPIADNQTKGVSAELDGVTRRASGYTVLAYSASVDNESEVAYVRAVM